MAVIADMPDFWSNLADKIANDMPTRLPSVKSMLLNGGQIVLGAQSYFGGLDVGNAPSCANPQLSCHNQTAIEDLCCFNYPGGQMLQTQFWDTNPPTGPEDAWTIHGLWPDRCDGSYEANCDDKRAYHNIRDILESFGATDLLSNMTTYWKDYKGQDENLWMHEWAKHGTCVSTLNPSCYSSSYRPKEEVVDYFAAAVSLYQQRPTYEWLMDAGIEPSTSKSYTRAEIQDALESRHGKPVTLGCKGGKFDEVWYHFEVRGSVQTGEFVAADPDGGKSTCPYSGIRYPPKGRSVPAPTASHTRTRTHVPEPTGPPFSGTGHLKVLTQGKNNGIVIGIGKWYQKGTPAQFRATQHEDGFTLASRKGKCAVVQGMFGCGPKINDPTVFASDGSSLSFNGSTTFYAKGEPTKWDKVVIHVDNDNGSLGTELEVEWQAA
ncbi:ribonuclease-like protein T2 [Aureobasidium pullulans]|uniref:Ribonuclease T2-like n=1 Tax=Aureobasidium pullulans TaxID=5580 RepID=A0A4T0DMQ5_AURPU|nr:ribonuclease-like protein T2 [Aureobasidium pullulans]